jgi:hypothetical protein
MDFNQWYWNTITFFEEHNAQVFIHGSTLLGAVRDDILLQRIVYDNELNFGIRAEDCNMQLLQDMKDYFPFFNAIGDLNQNPALIYFGPEPIINYTSINKTMWDMKPGIGLLAIFWRGKTKWIEYMGRDVCLTWPIEQLNRFNNIDLAHRRVSTPNNKHDWLSHYFGEDYMHEKREWHWSSDSLNRETYQDLQKQGEI